jgi:hypothetical protein
MESSSRRPDHEAGEQLTCPPHRFGRRRLEGFLLMIASSIASLAVLVGAWALLRAGS